MSLASLHPDLLPLCEIWLDRCKEAGLNIKVIQTWRDPAYQDRLYAKGRSTPGLIVTNLKGSESFHCFTILGKPASRALDFACFNKNGAYITDGTENEYTLAGKIGISLGLVWGGAWSGFKDYDHLQLPNASPTTAA